jgi:hypothetical protein
MHKRPKLIEALQVLKSLAHINEECAEALEEYNNFLAQGQEFFAARFVVDIVDHYYHVLDSKGIAHG